MEGINATQSSLTIQRGHKELQTTSLPHKQYRQSKNYTKTGITVVDAYNTCFIAKGKCIIACNLASKS